MNLDWKSLFKIGFEKTEVLGLDIGSSAVKVVKLRKDDTGYAVTAAGIAEIAIRENDYYYRDTDTATAICQCLQSARIKTELAVCGVSGPEVAVRDFEFPSLTPEEIEGAVLLEASQACPFDAGDSAVAHQLLSTSDDDTAKGILVAATNRLIENKVRLAEQARLKCVLVDVDGLALLNCFNELADEDREPQAGQTTVILNVGGSHTTLAIMGDDGWPFIRDLSCAGDDIVKRLAIEKDMSMEAVMGILSDDSPTPQVELNDSLEKACRELVAGVAETLRYYVTQIKSAPVDKIFVCGGFAQAKGFVEILNNQLPVEAALWNPFDKMPCDAGRWCEEVLAKEGPVMAVAAGLAMRSV